MLYFNQMLDCVGRSFRRWWDSLLLPPKPSEFFMFWEDRMSHTKKAVVALPAMRADETAYDPPIVARQLTYTIDGGQPTTALCPLSMADFEISGVPDSSMLSIALANVCNDGRLSTPTVRTFKAPDPEPVPTTPVPAPDAASVTFQDEPDPPATKHKK